MDIQKLIAENIIEINSGKPRIKKRKTTKRKTTKSKRKSTTRKTSAKRKTTTKKKVNVKRKPKATKKETKKTVTRKTTKKETKQEQQNIKRPTPKNYPNGITEKAKELWPKFLRKYRPTIKEAIEKRGIEYGWATAIAIFRNYCLKRNVVPFKNESLPAKDQRENLKKLIETSREKCKDIIKKVITNLKKRDLIGRIKNETFEKISYAKNMFYISFNIEFTFKKDVKRNDERILKVINIHRFKKTMKNKPFFKQFGSASSPTYLFFRITKKGNNLIGILNIVIALNKAKAYTLLGLEEKEPVKKAKKELEKEIKKIYRKTTIKKSHLS